MLGFEPWQSLYRTCAPNPFALKTITLSLIFPGSATEIVFPCGKGGAWQCRSLDLGCRHAAAQKLAALTAPIILTEGAYSVRGNSVKISVFKKRNGAALLSDPYSILVLFLCNMKKTMFLPIGVGV